MSDESGAYMGRAACGHVVAVIVDMPEHRDHVSKEIARWVRSGLIIEHTTVSLARPQIIPSEHKACMEAQKQARKAKRAAKNSLQGSLV